MTSDMSASPRPGAMERLLKPAQRNFFSTPTNGVINMVGLALFFYCVWQVLDWAFLDSIWTVENADRCRDATGACWAVIDARWRLIFFGLYPEDEHWRSALACVAVLVVAVCSCIPYFWSSVRLPILWGSGFAAFVVLMNGGVLGLDYVPTAQWGGLALTVFIFSAVTVLGMPLAILLAFGRRSEMPVIARLCGFLIDTIRSFPLLSILFVAAVIFPFVLPDWLQGDKLTRVVIGYAIFFACYQAEIIRGGLQAIPGAQEEAAKALGMGYLDRVFYILLPQAFRNSLPTTINQLVVTFKETSIVVIIGFFEILAAANAAFGTGDWVHTYVEVYVFVSLVYFIFVFSLSRYGAYLERRMRVGRD